MPRYIVREIENCQIDGKLNQNMPTSPEECLQPDRLLLMRKSFKTEVIISDAWYSVSLLGTRDVFLQVDTPSTRRTMEEHLEPNRVLQRDARGQPCMVPQGTFQTWVL